MICKNCGKNIPDGSKYCNFCGMEQDLLNDKKEDLNTENKLKKSTVFKSFLKRMFEGDKYIPEDPNDPNEIKAKRIVENVGIISLIFMALTIVFYLMTMFHYNLLEAIIGVIIFFIVIGFIIENY